MLSRDTGIDVSQLLLTEIDGLTFKKTFRDSQQVSCLKPPAKSPAVDKSKKGAATKAAASPAAAAAESSSESSSLYCIEMPRHREDSEDDGAFIVLTWVNVLKEGPIEKRSVRFERDNEHEYKMPVFYFGRPIKLKGENQALQSTAIKQSTPKQISK